jgi:hypothetical protein
MKLLILGHARHGKDSLAEILRDRCGLTFLSSSQAAARIFLFDKLKDKYDYTTYEECFNDRVNHREEWYQEICAYNESNRAQLAEDILGLADCYVGMRDAEEFEASVCRQLFDLIIWVDASSRVPLESSSSFNITMDHPAINVIINNNGSYDEFVEKVENFIADYIK